MSTGHLGTWREREQAERGTHPMQIKLELVPLPVSDVDRAIAFYGGKLGFKIDVRCVSAMSLPRSEGKGRRFVDERQGKRMGEGERERGRGGEENSH